MVCLSLMRTSNDMVASAFATPLVALFVGATSGIGEATLKAFALHSKSPTAYFVGRSQAAADLIVAECKAINPLGKFIFIQADVSLISVVDKVCAAIKEHEKKLDLVFLSQGVMSLDKEETSEELHLLAALNYYSRIYFITKLLPLIKTGTSLRRVVSVGGGSMEGPLDTDDFPALHTPLERLRGHLSTLVTLGLEAVQKTAPEVTFVHNYPGTVLTGLYRHMEALPFEPKQGTPLEECGERHLYFATSARYSPQVGNTAGVPLGEGVNVAFGTTGETRTGVYSIGPDGESASNEVIAMLRELRQSGIVEEVKRHTTSQFERIAGDKMRVE